MASTRVRSALAVAAIGAAMFATLGEASPRSTSTGSQGPSVEATSGTSKTSSSATAKRGSPSTAEVATTLAAPAPPAAPDASPYVEGFGDLSVVPLPAGDPDAVSIIASAPSEGGSSVNMVVRNNTRKAVGRIDVTGTARDEAGKLVGSGNSTIGLWPRVVAPGEIAFGYVFFKSENPSGSPLKYTFAVTSKPPDTFDVPLAISEMNNTGNNIIGAVTNGSGSKVTSISGYLICFGYDGSILNTTFGSADPSDLADGATGTFSIDLHHDPCPIGLVTADGNGH